METMGFRCLILAGVVACVSPPAGGAGGGGAGSRAEPGHFVFRGGRLPGGRAADVEVRSGKIVAVGTIESDAPDVDIAGKTLAPAFIDSHVHLAYLPASAEHLRGGVAAVVDLGSPMETLEIDERLLIVQSGPFITGPGGYPTQTWGANGYGVECEAVACLRATVVRLGLSGAGVIKLAVTGSELDDHALKATVLQAHMSKLRVAGHAIASDDVVRAAFAGVDILAHTPVEKLSRHAIDQWATGPVITTLVAFGAGDAAIDNLRRLRERGALVLYGTHLGNTSTTGISADEIRAMQRAGMTGSEIVKAGTTVPAAYWRFRALGTIAPGYAASVLVLSADPYDDPVTLASPLAVYVAGERVDL